MAMDDNAEPDSSVARLLIQLDAARADAANQSGKLIKALQAVHILGLIHSEDIGKSVSRNI